MDQFICIFTSKGEIEGKLNINHPLPIKWFILGEIAK
jgi:hypothetical protein